MPQSSTGVQCKAKTRLWQLEALRGLAAFHLLTVHISSSYLGLKHTLWDLPFRFGQEGVLIFFLLSGFVICYSNGASGAEAPSFANYLLKRGRRIYPIFLFSLLLAYAVQCVGAHRWLAVDFRGLLGNVLMLQDHPDKPGVFMLPFADNMPLWSLSYEWWFYMMFYPINRWVAAARQKYLVLGLCGVGLLGSQFIPNSFFNFLVLFLVWWAGVEMAREFQATGDVTLRRQGVMVVFLAGPAFWYGMLIWRWKAAGLPIVPLKHPFVEFRYFFVAIGLIFFGFAWKQIQFRLYRQTIGLFEWFGSISYALYVFHYPIICDLRLVKGSTPVFFYADLCLRVALVIGIAWIAEGIVQKWINAATNPWLRSLARRQVAARPIQPAVPDPLPKAGP